MGSFWGPLGVTFLSIEPVEMDEGVSGANSDDISGNIETFELTLSLPEHTSDEREG